MNKYTVDITSQGDIVSATLKENGVYSNLFYGNTSQEVIQKAKDYVDYLKNNPLQSEIIWKDGDQTITYYIQGLHEWMILYNHKIYKCEAKTLVNKEGHIYHSFTDALEILKQTILANDIQTIEL